MRVEGEKRFDASRDRVWAVLNDPRAMARTMPGIESFDVQDDRHWTAHVKIPLGLGGLKMKIKFEKTEERAPEFAKLAARGEGVGAIMSMETSFELSDADAGATSMKWAADVKIAGPVGGMGQRVLQPIVNQQVSNVLKSLEEQVQAAATGAPAAGEPGAGTSGADEGISPLASEAYQDEREGPTTSTET